jgi:hypothetical protein
MMDILTESKEQLVRYIEMNDPGLIESLKLDAQAAVSAPMNT